MVNPEQVSEIVQHFCGVTACNPEEAHFFLESCNWELDSAIHSFYENTGNSQPSSPLEEALPVSNPVPPASQLAPVPSRGQPPMAGKDKKSAKPTARGGIRTLSDLNRPSGSDSDDSDDPQEYYTGGEKSGMLVQDPSKGSNDVDSIFDGARRVGATEVPPDQLRPSSSSTVFSGVGRLLSGETVPSAPRPPEPIVHNITFWRNGFTVGDGPLRRLDDPENGPFLESIKKSECPKELEPADRRVPVHVNLIRREGDCPVQEQAYTPFQGVGRTLGGSSSTIPAPSIPSRSQPDSSQPLRGLTVDDSKPSTSIQLRLSDGTRMVARFNYHHTIADIRAFIDAARPGGSSTYQLQAMGFPPKPLNDPIQTIEQAGLINSVVLQKL